MLHILLVEDLPSEREILATAFENRGLRVSAVGSDVEAYKAIRSGLLNDVSAVVTDVNLGHGTTGFDVARAARAVRPDLAVIYMTAYDLQTEPHAVAESLTLRKPLRLTEVADSVLDFLQEQHEQGGGARATSA